MHFRLHPCVNFIVTEVICRKKSSSRIAPPRREPHDGASLCCRSMSLPPPLATEWAGPRGGYSPDAHPIDPQASAERAPDPKKNPPDERPGRRPFIGMRKRV